VEIGIHEAFTVHKLNADGLSEAEELAQRFSDLLSYTESVGIDARLNAIVRTKLEEACFFAKKSLAKNPENQE